MAATSAAAADQFSASSASAARSASAPAWAGLTASARPISSQRGGAVVAVGDGDARQADVGVGVVGVDLEHVLERRPRRRRRCASRSSTSPQSRLAAVARGSARTASRRTSLASFQLPSRRTAVAIAIRSAGRVRVDLAAVPVGVAGVDERGQRRAIADGVVEAHQRVADREVVGARVGRRLQPLARLGRAPERELRPARTARRVGGIDGRAPAASAAAPAGAPARSGPSAAPARRLRLGGAA